MTTIEILKAARKLLSAPERWTTEVLARNASGQKVEPTDESASRWCMSGACIKVGGEALLYQISDLLRVPAMPPWNDAPDRTHAEVLARFDEAIARLEAKEIAP